MSVCPAFFSWLEVLYNYSEAEAHRKSKQGPHQGCLFAIHHNLGTKHNEWTLLSGDSLSGPQPAFVWLWAATQYQQPQRKGPVRVGNTLPHLQTQAHNHKHTHTHFVLILCIERNKDQCVCRKLFYYLARLNCLPPGLLWFTTSLSSSFSMFLQVGKQRTVDRRVGFPLLDDCPSC